MVVATPGKLLALSESGNLPLDRVAYLVVDESDRFMQGSMEEEIRKASFIYVVPYSMWVYILSLCVALRKCLIMHTTSRYL